MSNDLQQDHTMQVPGSASISLGSVTTQPEVVPPPASLSFKYFRAPDITSSRVPSDVPESFFTPSPADLKSAQDTLSARTQSLVNAPLRTQAMRDTELKARQARWPTVTIRIRFPDRSQLEKTFPSSDKIRSIYAFVRGSLREDIKPIKFILYQTPPKRELKVSDPKVRDLSLLDLQLAPSSVLHLKFEDDSLNHINVPAPLDLAILSQAQDLPIPPNPEDEGPKPSSSSSTALLTQSVQRSGNGSVSEKKVPKWFKLGKKT